MQVRGKNQPNRLSAHDQGKLLLGDNKGEKPNPVIKQRLLSEMAVSLLGPTTLGGTKVGSWLSTEDFNFGKINPIGNKRRSPLNFNSNWIEHVYGKKWELRKSDWTWKSLTLEVNGEGKRTVAWNKGGLRSSIRVLRGQRDHMGGEGGGGRGGVLLMV